MIHYALRCAAAHEFDGWFKSSAAFEAQAAGGYVECPHCGSTAVTRGLMAPNLGRKSNQRPAQAQAEPAEADRTTPAPGAGAGAPTPLPASAPRPEFAAANPAEVAAPVNAGGHMPDHLRAMLQRLRQEVEARCDYVGSDFAREARRIHAGETDPRAIYGETTRDEAESLAEDGIPCTAIPWVPRADG